MIVRLKDSQSGQTQRAKVDGAETDISVLYSEAAKLFNCKVTLSLASAELPSTGRSLAQLGIK